MNIHLAFRHTSLLAIVLLLLSTSSHAQFISKWDKVYGGDSWDNLNGLVALPDGYMLAGYSRSSNISLFPTSQTFDFLLTRTNAAGDQLWSKSYGGDQHEYLWDMIQTQGGDFLLLGASWSGSSGTKIQANNGTDSSDYYLVKVDKDGELLWERSYGGDGHDEAFSVKELANGDLLLVGTSTSTATGDKTEANFGSTDCWVLLLDPSGNIKWQTTLGGDQRDLAYDMVVTPDQKSVFITGGTASTPNTGTIGTDARRGGMDFWCVKLDLGTQKQIWSRRFGGGGVGIKSLAYRILLSFDGNLILGGLSHAGVSSPGASFNGKDSPHRGNFNLDSDYWVIKIDQKGNKIPGFDISLGGTGLDVCYSLYENFFGDLYVGGVSDSNEGGNKTAKPHGKYDVWVVSLDRNWAERSQISYGGSNWDSMSRMVGKPDGSIVIGGHSSSTNDGTKTQTNLGDVNTDDFYLITTDCGFSDGQLSLPVTNPCVEATITLQAGADTCATCVYFWSTGDQGPTLDIEPGFRDTVKLLTVRRDGCMMRDAIMVNNPIPPTIDLGVRDTVILEGQNITIGGNNPELKYLWGSGDTSASIVVGYAGVWSLTVTDPNGCTASDWMRVYIADKEAVYIPNVFSPDFNGKNDYFNVYGDASLEKIVSLDIFDRWGAHLFHRGNYSPNYETDGWDGTFRGREMPIGAYKYATTVRFVDQTQKQYEGMITIVR
jgi:gliding motility-associated-like protein